MNWRPDRTDCLVRDDVRVELVAKVESPDGETGLLCGDEEEPGIANDARRPRIGDPESEELSVPFGGKRAPGVFGVLARPSGINGIRSNSAALAMDTATVGGLISPETDVMSSAKNVIRL